jgi:hypothetical protein
MVTSIQIGADYNHYGDERFTHMPTEETAREVFHDAETLVAWAKAYRWDERTDR